MGLASYLPLTRNLRSTGSDIAAAAKRDSEVLLWQLEEKFYICTVQYSSP